MDGRILMKVEEVDALGCGVMTEEIDVCTIVVFAFFVLCLVRRGDRVDSAEAAARAAGLFWRTDCLVTRIAFFPIETTRGVPKGRFGNIKANIQSEKNRRGKRNGIGEY